VDNFTFFTLEHIPMNVRILNSSLYNIMKETFVQCPEVLPTADENTE